MIFGAQDTSLEEVEGCSRIRNYPALQYPAVLKKKILNKNRTGLLLDLFLTANILLIA